MSFKKNIAQSITLENANEWNDTTEKWLFVTGLIADAEIEYDPFSDQVDRYVDYVEAQFDKLLKKTK